jgi:hypothetical protein
MHACYQISKTQRVKMAEYSITPLDFYRPDAIRYTCIPDMMEFVNMYLVRSCDSVVNIAPSHVPAMHIPSSEELLIGNYLR